MHGAYPEYRRHPHLETYILGKLLNDRVNYTFAKDQLYFAETDAFFITYLNRNAIGFKVK